MKTSDVWTLAKYSAYDLHHESDAHWSVAAPQARICSMFQGCQHIGDGDLLLMSV